MKLPFRSLEIFGFRSASEKGVLLEDISSLNFLCGQNNSGKSNVLFFITLLCNNIAHSNKYAFERTDYHQGDSGQIRFRMQFNYEFMLAPDNVPVSEEIERFLTESREQLEGMWFEYSLDTQAKPTLLGSSVLDEATQALTWYRKAADQLIRKKFNGS